MERKPLFARFNDVPFGFLKGVCLGVLVCAVSHCSAIHFLLGT